VLRAIAGGPASLLLVLGDERGATHAKMNVMTDVATTHNHEVSSAKARILVYSDDKNVREKVRFAVGSTTHGRTIEWTESATHDATIGYVDHNAFDLVILDGEAAKSGGMGICRQMKHELYHCPPVLLLVGRVDDAWLATWSEADAAVAHPLDPFVVKDAVDEFFVEPQDPDRN
jgi:CheY-like chemotaxis protein